MKKPTVVKNLSTKARKFAKGVKRSIQRLEKIKRPFNPNGWFRFIWDTILILCLTVDVVNLPLVLSFSQDWDDNTVEHFNALEIFQTVVFIVIIIAL